MIHPTALVDAAAHVGEGVEIGPFCLVGRDVALECGVRLLSHVVIEGPCRIGAGTVVHPFARLGGPPQDASYRGEPTRLEIGANCLIREHVTMNRGTVRGRGVTQVGSGGHFMAYAHVGHDCELGADVTFANGATLGGHVVIGDGVNLGGLTAIHQRVRIGRLAMIGGTSGVVGDVAPFSLVLGNRASWAGLNLVGLKRQGFSSAQVRALRTCFGFLYDGPGTFEERLAEAPQRFAGDANAQEVVEFMASCKARPLTLRRSRWRNGGD